MYIEKLWFSLILRLCKKLTFWLENLICVFFHSFHMWKKTSNKIFSEKIKKKLHGFSHPKSIATFEVFHWVISSSINLLFLKSVLRAYCMQCIYIRPQTPNILPKGGQKYYKIGQKMQDYFLWQFSENVSKVIIGVGENFHCCEFWIYKFMTFGLFKILIYTYLYTLLLFLLLEMLKYFVFLIFFCSSFFIFKNLS